MAEDTMSIRFREDVKAQLEALSTSAGVSEDEIVQDAVERYLLVRRFRELRGEMMQELEERGIRLTDEDIFREVS